METQRSQESKLETRTIRIKGTEPTKVALAIAGKYNLPLGNAELHLKKGRCQIIFSEDGLERSLIQVHKSDNDTYIVKTDTTLIHNYHKARLFHEPNPERKGEPYGS